jgi:uncharacterized membrane protein YjgN (DUF898 family)
MNPTGTPDDPHAPASSAAHGGRAEPTAHGGPAEPAAGAAEGASTPSPAPMPRPLPLRFTASGSEYFRIWAVNLLLIVVTLGFYLPFAKARRLRYFYANTLVDGQPLAFHGDAWKMFRGYLVMLLLFGAYAGASYVSDWVAFGAFILLALLWPALWRSSLMFRLGNTSWRGLRFGFEGTLGGAYQAMLPLFVPGAVVLGVSAWALSGVAPDDDEAVRAASMAMLPGTLVSMLLALVLVPLAFWMIKRYQHGGYRYAHEATTFTATRRSFYGLGLKVGGLAMLAAFVLGAIAGLVFPAIGALSRSLSDGGGGNPVVLGVLGGLLGVLLYVAAISWLGAFAAAWTQNLTWRHTQSAHLRFGSQLGGIALTRLTIRNLLLVVLTLGLYRPFAVVNTTRMRLEAVTLESSEDIDRWVALPSQATGNASGEMSGDFFGIDVGL